MAHLGRPESYVQLILALEPFTYYDPEAISLRATSNEVPANLRSTMNRRAGLIRQLFPGIQTVDGLINCYPGILWQATIRPWSLGSARFAHIQQEAAAEAHRWML